MTDTSDLFSTISQLQPCEFAVSPTDGRYSKLTKKISTVYSNEIFYLTRIRVEMAYIEILLKKYNIDYKLPVINYDNYEEITTIYKKCIEIEKTTNHDIKAIEFYLRTIIPEEYHRFIHCGLTSQDVNSVAQTIMLKNVCKIIMDEYTKFQKSINNLIFRLKDKVVMTYTHGQPAVQSFFDIEVKKRLIKMNRSFQKLIECCNNLTCKFSGSIGNFTTLSLIFKEDEIDTLYHDLNTKLHCDKIIDGINFNLKFNKFAFQIDDYNSYSELFNQYALFLSNIKDFSYNIWLRLLNKELIQSPVDGEIGSSVMSHKINPIGLEQASGIIDIIVSQCQTTATTLLVTSFSRDISDNIKLRFAGNIFGSVLIVLSNIKRDIDKLIPNTHKIDTILSENIASLSELIQTRLRIEDIKIDAYKELEKLTKGKIITYEILHEFIDMIAIKYTLSEKIVSELKSFNMITPCGYFSHYEI
jgi:adenylosuccinate lyase